MRRPSKLTPAVVAKIAARRAKGVPYEAIAREFGVSEGSVRNAILAAKNAKAKAGTNGKTPAALAVASGDIELGPPTQEELRGWLAEQIRGLRADATRLREEGDVPALEATNRQLVSAMQILGRLTPDPPPREDPNEAKDMRAMAEEVSARLHKLVSQVAGEPTPCPECARRAAGLSLDRAPDSARRIA